MSTSIVNSLVVVLLQHYLLLISDFLPYLVWDIYRNNAHWYTLPIGFYDCCWCLTITMHVLTSLFLLQNLLDDTIVEEYQVPGTTAFLLVLCHYDDGDGVEPNGHGSPNKKRRRNHAPTRSEHNVSCRHTTLTWCESDGTYTIRRETAKIIVFAFHPTIRAA